MPTKPSGYILHNTDDIVVIATLESDNRKTGNMIQIWILAAGTDPVTAIKLGWDQLVCGDCVHRGRHMKLKEQLDQLRTLEYRYRMALFDTTTGLSSGILTPDEQRMLETGKLTLDDIICEDHS